MMTDKSKIKGFEFGWECGNCEKFMSISAMLGDSAIIDGEKTFSTREVFDGQILECTGCGEEYKLTFEKQ